MKYKNAFQLFFQNIHSRKECETQVKGFPKAVFKKFSTQVEALAFINVEKPTGIQIIEKSVFICNVSLFAI